MTEFERIIMFVISVVFFIVVGRRFIEVISDIKKGVNKNETAK